MKISNHLVAGAVLVLGGLVSAQGTYTTFGQGCPGTGGGTVCASANASTTALPYSQNLNIFALGVPTSTTVKVVMGFELFTQTINQTTPLTINTQIYYTDSTGKPATTPQVTGTMTIGMTPGWYRTTFSKPLIVPANQKFFLSYTSVANRMKAPYGSTGTKVSRHPAQRLPQRAMVLEGDLRRQQHPGPEQQRRAEPGDEVLGGSGQRPR
jgi:hypothetical protein